ncbi:MAG: peptide chain release factor 2 [Culicoidibacterales bacterium]
MELYEIRNELTQSAEKLEEFRGSLDIAQKEAIMSQLENKMLETGFWDDQKAAQLVIQELNGLKSQYEEFQQLAKQLDNLQEGYEMLKEEADPEMQNLLEDELGPFLQSLKAFELTVLLSGTYDKNNAILELHPGAGGTESQDWAEMLYRMYTRWAEKQGYKVELLDYLAGDEAGIKSVTILIKGMNAYGYLKSERGVHRLVRISPFDSSGRRHTSFVSCHVMPEINDDMSVEISENDLKIDTYRSGGAGGQSVNTTDSAVRITHLPTGIVVTCQNERSQIKNRAAAMQVLRGRIYEKQVEEQAAKLAGLGGEKKEIGWGSQIRSYVFHPYSMVKDHRTNTEVGNVQAVMDGEITAFIRAYLQASVGQNNE